MNTAREVRVVAVTPLSCHFHAAAPFALSLSALPSLVHPSFQTVFLGVYFGVYEHTKAALAQAVPGPLGILLAGGAVSDLGILATGKNVGRFAEGA